MTIKMKYKVGQKVYYYGDGDTIGDIEKIQIEIDPVRFKKPVITYCILRYTKNIHGSNKDYVEEDLIAKVLNKKQFEKEYTKVLAKMTAEEVVKENKQ